MKKDLYGLKTTVIVNLAFLIITAMLLLGLVVVKLIEKNLVEQNVRHYLLTSRMIEVTIRTSIMEGKDEDARSIKRSLENYLQYLAHYSGYEWLGILDRRGRVIIEGGKRPPRMKFWNEVIRKTIATNSFHMKMNYSLFSPFRSSPPRVLIATPLNLFSHRYSLMVGFGEMQQEWRSIIHAISIISFYILMNALVLLGFGLYIFHRRVIGPINKMVESVAEIGEGDRLPVFEETRGNELGRLSKAINIMLQRLEENKKELRKTIRSLEDANQNLNKVQKELIHSEKMASVGRLASGIAHEIGNPLGIVLGYLDILKTDKMDDTSRKDLLERMETELVRIRSIITRLLDFARPGKGKKEETDLHKLLEETCSLIRHHCSKKGIELILDLNAENPIIYSDPNQLKQVFLNLFFNSIDSIEGDGKVAVRTYKLEDETSKKVKKVVVEIEDTGHGIPRESLDKIFDPFFTTKEPGKGTGLGLSVSSSILKSINASISVESEEKWGTRVTVAFDTNIHP